MEPVPSQTATQPPQPSPASQPQPTPDTTVGNSPVDSTVPPAQQEMYMLDDGYMPNYVKPQKEEVLMEWKAASRPFRKHNRQFYSTVGVIGALIGFILFFAGQILPVAVVFAVVFLTYVMHSIPPGVVTHKLTTYGIRVEDELYYWEELGRFWIKEKYGAPVLYIEVSRFPSRLTILLGDLTAKDMEEILSEVLLNEEPPPTSYEKAAKWLHEKIPIDLEL